MSLKITNLSVGLQLDQKKSIKPILTDINLEIKPGELLVILGLNGSGKSTFAKALLGHPEYKILSGKIELDGKDLTNSDPTTRARAGLLLASQQPTEIPGVNLENYLRIVYNSLAVNQGLPELPVFKFRKILKTYLEILAIPLEFLSRNLNEGFSGGEKKKLELLQMLVFQPKYIVLDEIDSGLDVKASKLVFNLIADILSEKNPIWEFGKQKPGFILITHNSTLTKYIEPNRVVLFKTGAVHAQGGSELISQFS